MRDRETLARRQRIFNTILLHHGPALADRVVPGMRANARKSAPKSAPELLSPNDLNI